MRKVTEYLMVVLLIGLVIVGNVVAGGILRQNTAVNVVLGPFLDDTDGKSAETALTISQADVKLSKAGGALTQKTEVTSCTHDTVGYYYCPIDATDTNTLGRLKIIVSESGALPVWDDYTVLHANVYDVTFGTVAPSTLSTGSTIAGATTCTSVTNAVDINSNADITAILADTAAVDTTTEMRTFLTGGDTALSTVTTAQVNTEVDTALADINLDHLVGTATGIPSIVAGTYIDQIMDDGTATYDRTTDSLQAIKDAGTGGATAQQVWEYAINGCETANWACTYVKSLYDSQDWNPWDAVARTVTGGTVDTATTCTTASACTSVTNDVNVSDADVAGAVWNAATVTYGGAGSYGLLVETNLDAAVSTRGTSTLTTSDNIGINWGDVSNPTTSVGLSGTTIGTVTTTTTATTATTCTNLTNWDKTGYSIADSTSDAVIADAVWNAATVTYGGAGSYGLLVETDLDAAISSRSTLTAANVWDLDISGYSGAKAGTYLKSLYDSQDWNPWDAVARTVTGGTVDTLTGHTPQTGDSYAIVSHGTYGNSAIETLVDGLETDSTAIKAKTDNLPAGIKKNTALNNFEFLMVLSSDHVTAATGKTVVCQRSIDGAAFGACANAVAEVANGIYKVNLANTDLNGDTVTLKFTEATCDSRLISIKTNP